MLLLPAPDARLFLNNILQPFLSRNIPLSDNTLRQLYHLLNDTLFSAYHSSQAISLQGDFITKKLFDYSLFLNILSHSFAVSIALSLLLRSDSSQSSLLSSYSSILFLFFLAFLKAFIHPVTKKYAKRTPKNNKTVPKSNNNISISFFQKQMQKAHRRNKQRIVLSVLTISIFYLEL